MRGGTHRDILTFTVFPHSDKWFNEGYYNDYKEPLFTHNWTTVHAIHTVHVLMYASFYVVSCFFETSVNFYILKWCIWCVSPPACCQIIRPLLITFALRVFVIFFNRYVFCMYVFITQELYGLQTPFHTCNAHKCSMINCTKSHDDDKYSLWVIRMLHTWVLHRIYPVQ